MKHEALIRFTTGVVLWALSAIMVGALYASFAGDHWFAWPVACLLGISLEASKLLAWRRGGPARYLAVVLSVLTVLSVMGTTIATIEGRKADSQDSRREALQQSIEYRGLETQLQGVDAREKALLARMAVIPADFTTPMTKILTALEVEKNLRASLITKLDALEKAPGKARENGPVIFSSLARTFGFDEALLELAIVLVLAVVIEVSAFTLLGHSGHKEQKAGPRPRKIHAPVPIPVVPQTRAKPVSQKPRDESSSLSPETYLASALDHPRKPYLLGRGVVAERLGIPDREARALLDALFRAGRIRRESKFFVAVD